jgi:hypothetical protein
MDLRPSREATSFASFYELPYVLYNPKVDYRVHNSSPPVSVLSHINLS